MNQPPGLTGWRVDRVGLLVGTVFALLAMTPSLLPRSWLFQGVVAGISAAAGYGMGAAVAWSARRWSAWIWVSDRVRRWPSWSRRLLEAAGLIAVATALVGMLLAAAGWQQQIAALMGTDPPTDAEYLWAGPVLLAVAGSLVAGARAARWVARRVARVLRRYVRLPAALASATGALVVALLAANLFSDVVVDGALTAADAAFQRQDRGTDPGVEAPRAAGRSGSAASLVAWESLGRQGRAFAAGGPSTAALRAGGAATASQPVRVYVGLESAPTAQERAELAVAELERSGGLDRSVLLVVTTTGTGWVNAAAVDSLELMHGGDTAVVATQYSYLPSWLSFLVDRPRAAQAGRLLFDAVSARVQQLPEQDRPRLLVYGESLGSQGSEAAFSSLADIRAQTDGVLWVGPPNSNQVWSALVERRDPGTRQVRPVYSSGQTVRFAGRAADLARPPAPWEHPRVLYLQHPSDPIVWWSPDLLFQRPDWLVEPRGQDVLPAMSWYPLVTFWQLAADLVHSTSVPDGHGHNYDSLILDAWAAVAAPEGWTAADTAQVRALLDG